MNIFNALSQGRGNLNEENLTAILGFLLNPNAEHGLKDIFLRRFLSRVDNDSFESILEYCSGDYKVDITFESPYEYEGKIRRIDIDLRVFCENEEKARILIENKIKSNSADKNQFKEEYLGVKSELISEEREIPIFMVFLTPFIESDKLLAEFDSLDNVDMNPNHKKIWLKWDGIDKVGTISFELRQILIEEERIMINPISEYVRHTLKALIRYINDQLIHRDKTSRHRPLMNDEWKNSFEFDLDDIDYRMEEYESSAIKVINLETQEYVVAKPIIREVIKRLKMPIELHNSNGRKKNTRQLGREVMKHTDRVFRYALKNDPNSVTKLN